MDAVTPPKQWDPAADWRPADVHWVRVDIANEDLKRFSQRSNLKGFAQTLGFLAVFAATGTFSYLAYANGLYLLFALGLLVHGTFYPFFGSALHELGHNTVFANRRLNQFFSMLLGWLNWPFNPFFYRLSHNVYHHRYTLYQKSDGEEVPQYVDLSWKTVLVLLFRVVRVKDALQNLGRLLTLKPASYGWRGQKYRLDPWEQFVLSRSKENEVKRVRRFALFCLLTHVPLAVLAFATGWWILPVLITFAPFYGSVFLVYHAGIQQHAACEANCPDFRDSCGDVVLDPFTSFLYWHMEYHIEHHSFAAIPCYNLKRFREFVEDQLPPREPALRRLIKIGKICKAKYGSYMDWKVAVGYYRGLYF